MYLKEGGKQSKIEAKGGKNSAGGQLSTDLIKSVDQIVVHISLNFPKGAPFERGLSKQCIRGS